MPDAMDELFEDTGAHQEQKSLLDPIGDPNGSTEEGEPGSDDGAAVEETVHDDSSEQSPAEDTRTESEKFFEKRHQDVMRELKEFDPSAYEYIRSRVRTRGEEAHSTAAQPEGRVADDEDPYLAEVRRMKQEVLDAMDARERAREQEMFESTWRREYNTADRALQQVLDDPSVPPEVMQRCIQQAGQMVDIRRPGGPTNIARLAMMFLEREMRSSNSDQWITKASADAASKAKAAAMVQQPGGSPVPAREVEPSENEMILNKMRRAGPNSETMGEIFG